MFEHSVYYSYDLGYSLRCLVEEHCNSSSEKFKNQYRITLRFNNAISLHNIRKD